MVSCRLCTVLGYPGEHKPLYVIAPFNLRVCECCWFAWAFGSLSDRRRLACPGSSETAYIHYVRGPDYEKALWARRLYNMGVRE